ncbi:hypothetical protein BGW36DRAFT_422407 [Talaromyces proteolyticus]|uniref:PRISE-like Rossmann-fold domain-containing protein n=1 Tax=Talaromyces proteolyticus TaxID=1131652 RepID=A0AAD4L1K7_9EURO|nr:uncharacterized protein BGW36DRAFT_422407 [Talaromyces proteolyticus]KAH8705873.1 hypothetical protein BGW36DRAFT_422407 [Talaromyces proteolyticus]
MSITKPRHALVIGASGLAGWAVVNTLLQEYPEKGTFAKVTAVLNRPLSMKRSRWPTSSSVKFQLVTGVNLSAGSLKDSVSYLRENIPDLHTVTHVYYFAYQQQDDPAEEIKVNISMLEGVITALNDYALGLEFLVVPTGSRAYGIYIPGGCFTPPYKESMGHVPEPERSKLHYYPMQDYLARSSKGKSWTWCDVRPDAIIGFTPNGSTFSLAAHWYNYLSLYAAVEGKGAKVPYPGVEAAYNSLFNGVSSGMIAKFSIWASLHPEKTGNGEIFNIVDQDRPLSMETHWPVIASFFNLEGTAPVEDQDPILLRPTKYAEKNKKLLRGGNASQLWKASWLDEYGHWSRFDRQYSVDKLRSVGFLEECDANSSWLDTFALLKTAQEEELDHQEVE